MLLQQWSSRHSAFVARSWGLPVDREVKVSCACQLLEPRNLSLSLNSIIYKDEPLRKCLSWIYSDNPAYMLNVFP